MAKQYWLMKSEPYVFSIDDLEREGSIQESKRHKSGFALRFPRIARWRHDKPAEEADRIDALGALIAAQ